MKMYYFYGNRYSDDDYAMSGEKMGNDIAVDTALKRFYIKPCYAREIKR